MLHEPQKHFGWKCQICTLSFTSLIENVSCETAKFQRKNPTAEIHVEQLELSLSRSVSHSYFRSNPMVATELLQWKPRHAPTMDPSPSFRDWSCSLMKARKIA
ncbi:hypothetical protein M0R45_036297 [Rubus argutus]|uniref:Uncharacterized protein n=1 Tax=Rubus argutus TaxID=59490 RepID=A0AAW1VXF7_RUBAR